MIFFVFSYFFLFAITSFSSTDTKFTFPTDQVQCPCPLGIDDDCGLRLICVYGINDMGKIFYNGRNDSMNLTNVAMQRKNEIIYDGFDADDVVVNLYNPYKSSKVIFYYACRKCDDLHNFGSNITVPKLKVFLLSLYNQRLKYNIKYAQSDFKYFDNPTDELQAMPIITVRPFWKNRLVFNETCAQKQYGFTQKHYIPAFLTQDLCLLDFKFINYTSIKNEFHTKNYEITYSWTLSQYDLYLYNVLPNSTKELPPDFQEKQEMCKIFFSLNSTTRLMRYFCICDTHLCTVKVTTKNPLQFCPYELKINFDAAVEYASINQTSEYMRIDEFFLQNELTYCIFQWQVSETGYQASIQRRYIPFSDGYTFNSTDELNPSFCPFEVLKPNLLPLTTTFYRNDTQSLQNAFMNATIDHSKIINDIYPVGANCMFEGELSNPFFSSGYGSNASMFPCYYYFDIYKILQVYPLMGINVSPITIIAKGKNGCYYYNAKVHERHFAFCKLTPPSTPPLMTIYACPENIINQPDEFDRIKKIVNACPTMAPGETQWKYKVTEYFVGNLCGQFLRGLKLLNGRYVPDEIELRQVTMDDFNMTGMTNAGGYHGCGFNATQNLTLCTCHSALGGCDDLYTAGRVHLLRYLPFKNSTYSNF